MTQNEKRIAIATACGWKHIEKLLTGWHGWHEIGPSEELPDYFGSLDACAEFEKMLTPDQQHEYWMAIVMQCNEAARETNNFSLVGIFYQITATAQQRCEAFGKALNLW